MDLSDYYFKEDPELVCGKKCSSITADFDENCPSLVDRYFTKFYYRKSDTLGTENEDHQVLFHSNRICLVGLAPSHVAFVKGIKSVDFNIGNYDRRENHCSGKGKKGAMNLQPSSALAVVTCKDDTQFKVVSCITGKLIEVNERLVDKPELLLQEGSGYVAICLPKIENSDNIKQSLMSEELYQKTGSDQHTN